jgi:hypothetical protein
MTEDEKSRLNEIMLDIDGFGDNKQVAIKEGSEENQTLIVDYNPFAVSLVQGDGFTPEKNALERLKHIDSVLEKRNSSRLTSHSTASGFTNSTNLKSATVTSNVVEPDMYFGLMVSFFLF